MLGRFFPPVSSVRLSLEAKHLGKLKNPPVKLPSPHRRAAGVGTPQRESLPFYAAPFARRLMSTPAPGQDPGDHTLLYLPPPHLDTYHFQLLITTCFLSGKEVPKVDN